jgi:beta-lactamase superfamily II metal-dependent hydrolase
MKKFVHQAIIAVILAVSCMLTACSEKTNSTNVKKEKITATDNFYVTVLDVGKADAIILRTKEHTAVIDCGEKGDGGDILDYLEENGIDYIDYLFITHFDKDHVGGAAKVIKNAQIGTIIAPDYTGSNEEYEKYIEAAASVNITPISLTEQMSFTLDDVSFEVYPPQKENYKEADNDYSLVISAVHGDNSFLFAGDAEQERLKELESMDDLQHTFLKVPHHGRADKETNSFFEKVLPKYAVITCSKKELPDSAVTDELEKIGAQVYLTSDGTVNAVSDGKTISIGG